MPWDWPAMAFSFNLIKEANVVLTRWLKTCANLDLNGRVFQVRRSLLPRFAYLRSICLDSLYNEIKVHNARRALPSAALARRFKHGELRRNDLSWRIARSLLRFKGLTFKNDAVYNLRMAESNTCKPSDELDALLDGKIIDFAYDQFAGLGSILNSLAFNSPFQMP